MGREYYPRSARLLHWTLAVMVVSMLLLGASMVDSLGIWRAEALRWHKWTGLLVLILVMIRIANRLRFRAPDLPADLPGWQVLAARVMMIALYCAMLVMPLSGWMMQGAAGVPVVLPGGWVLPDLVEPDIRLYGLLRSVHGLVSWLFMVLIVGHVGAALRHGWVRSDGVLNSMTGRFSQGGQP
ncbi:cytochrome b [Altererythrobacter sp.]|uniref:cytochrome b n=1 Tax=Altererythrobacter sp. TaxID=1872480 RepID=UPI003D01CF0D